MKLAPVIHWANVLEVSQKIKREPQEKGCTCRLDLLVIIGSGLCLLCLFLYTTAVYLPRAELQANIEKWRTHGSSKYRVTVMDWAGTENGNIVYVLSGQIVYQSEPHPDEPLAGAPIELYFKLLSGCVGSIFACSVKYDATYGFPTEILWPCLDACPNPKTELVDFELNPSFEPF